MKSGFYTTTSDDQLCGQTEKKLQSTSQSQTCTKKKVMVTVWWSAAVLIHDSFLNPSETISKSEKYAQQIDEMHWKLPCLQPALVNRKGQILFHNHAWLQVAQPTLQLMNELEYKVLPHPPNVLSCVQLFVAPWTVAHQWAVLMIFHTKILKWVAISYSRGSSQPRNWTCVSCVGRQIL